MRRWANPARECGKAFRFRFHRFSGLTDNGAQIRRGTESGARHVEKLLALEIASTSTVKNPLFFPVSAVMRRRLRAETSKPFRKKSRCSINFCRWGECNTVKLADLISSLAVCVVVAVDCFPEMSFKGLFNQREKFVAGECSFRSGIKSRSSSTAITLRARDELFVKARVPRRFRPTLSPFAIERARFCR